MHLFASAFYLISFPYSIDCTLVYTFILLISSRMYKPKLFLKIDENNIILNKRFTDFFTIIMKLHFEMTR